MPPHEPRTGRVLFQEDTDCIIEGKVYKGLSVSLFLHPSLSLSQASSALIISNLNQFTTQQSVIHHLTSPRDC